MTPLDAETQRILKWADEWIDDFDGYPSHLILMRDHIRSLSERLARVEAEEREQCAKLVPTNWCDPILTGPRAVFNPNERPEPNVERVLAAVAAAIRAGK